MSTRRYREQSKGTPSESGANTPGLSIPSSWGVPSVSNAVSGLLKLFSAEPADPQRTTHQSPPTSPFLSGRTPNNPDGVFMPQYRTASPFQPPPLYPISLHGYNSWTDDTAKLLTKSLAEEIRLLVPPRLQLCENWNLVYNLEEDGVSLGTLYKKCDDLRGLRNGFVLVVKDGAGDLFGAYLNEAPRIESHFFGNGECFLWRASFLSSSQMNLPPPPSADTTNMQRSTTIASPYLVSPTSPGFRSLSPTLSSNSFASITSERIRFKAFPYSGVNDYLMLCEAEYLSLGGGDGHYGLWLDKSFERGISSHCLTFGNEPLSDEGEKFEIMGVEVWSIGNLS